MKKKKKAKYKPCFIKVPMKGPSPTTGVQRVEFKTEIVHRSGVSTADPGIRQPDMVNFPPHYRKHPSGAECVQITEHMNFCLGNAVKYIWRSGEKGEQLQDLRKARFYLDREIQRLEKVAPPNV